MARRTESSPGGRQDAGKGAPRGRPPRVARTAERGDDRREQAAAGGTGGAVPAARADRLTKVYGTGDTTVTALRGIDLDFPRGRFTAIMGPSGSGKSTLMHCLAGLDTVTRGRVFIGDVDLSRLSDRELTRLRRDRIGFIFQQYNLLPTLTAAENITLPLSIAGRSPDQAWMRTVVDAVGLAPRLRHRPSELSGGQQQRVACARALATRPEIIFADEPTGNLDSRSGAEVLSFLRDSVTELGQTIVMVTHDATAASYSDEVIFLADGRLVDAIEQPTADEVLDRMKHLDAAQRGLLPDDANTPQEPDDYDDHHHDGHRHDGRNRRDDRSGWGPRDRPADRGRGVAPGPRGYPAADDRHGDYDYPDQRYGNGSQPTPYDGRYAEPFTGEFDSVPGLENGPLNETGPLDEQGPNGGRYGGPAGDPHRRRPVPRPLGPRDADDTGGYGAPGGYRADGPGSAGWA